MGAGLTHRRTLGGAGGPPTAEPAPTDAGGVPWGYGGMLRTNYSSALRMLLVRCWSNDPGPVVNVLEWEEKAGHAMDPVGFRI